MLPYSRFEEVSLSFLEQSKPGRCKSAIAPEEKSEDALKDHRSRDVYALGALIKSVMKGITDDGKR